MAIFMLSFGICVAIYSMFLQSKGEKTDGLLVLVISQLWILSSIVVATINSLSG